MQTQLNQMMAKLEHFPPGKLAEVEDFIDFLQQREQDDSLRQTYTHASETAFAEVWDNDADAAYDRI